MLINDIYLIADKVDVANDEQIVQAAEALNTHFPIGYQDYVTILGAGYLNGRLRVLTPKEIVAQTVEFRDRMRWLFEGTEASIDPFHVFGSGLDMLPPDRLLACILLADAGDGHEIIYHPDIPGDIFLLPHEQDGIYLIGHSIEEVATSFLNDERYVHKSHAIVRNGQFIHSSVYYFEPDPPRQGLDGIIFTLEDTITYADVRANLIDIAVHQQDDALLVSESYAQDDRIEVEHLHLFVKEYVGKVQTGNWPANHSGITVNISYSRDHHPESLEWLIEFFRSRSQLHSDFHIDPDGSWIPM